MKHHRLQKLQRSVVDHQFSARNALAREVADCDQKVLKSIVGMAGAADAVQNHFYAFNS